MMMNENSFFIQLISTLSSGSRIFTGKDLELILAYVDKHDYQIEFVEWMIANTDTLMMKERNYK